VTSWLTIKRVGKLRSAIRDPDGALQVRWSRARAELPWRADVDVFVRGLPRVCEGSPVRMARAGAPSGL